MELISVVIPVYNVEKYIRKALDSVIGQTYANLEIITVDDGSPDNSGKICDEYAAKDSRIKVIHKENGGVSSARNAGISLASGKWLYFMDPDDWIEPNALELALKKAKETDADAVFFDYEKVYPNHSVKYSSLNAAQTDKTFFDDLTNLNTLIVYAGGSVCCLFIKSACVKNKVAFNQSVKIGEDLIFRMACYAHISSFAHLAQTLYHYRDLPDSAMKTCISDFKASADKMYAELTLLNKKYTYPKNAQIVADSNCIFNLNRVILGAFQSKSARGKSAREIIFDYINSDNYQAAVKNYDTRLISGMAKIIVRFKKPTMFKIRLVFMAKRLKNFIDKARRRKH
mgnify:FL=1